MSNLDIKFKRLTPFKRCVLQNFPFIEADFDALTNYGLLCKVVEYLNKVIASQNEVLGVTQEIVDGFNNLYNYVNDYFKNLDVQNEINNKLDAMVEDGTFQTIVDAYLEQLTHKVKYIFPSNWAGAIGSNYGDCSIIKGYNKNIMIDTADSAYKTQLYSLMANNGVEHIDYLIISHFHADHCANTVNLINDGYLDENSTIYLPPLCNYLENLPTMMANRALILQAAQDAGIPIVTPAEGSALTIDSEFKIYFYNCDADNLNEEDYFDYNNYSMIAYVKHGNKRVLYTGDCYKLPLDRLVQEGFIDEKVDLYKVEHHGIEYPDSHTPFELLEVVTPDYAFIPVASSQFDAEGSVSESLTTAWLKSIGCKMFSSMNNNTQISFVSTLDELSNTEGKQILSLSNNFDEIDIYCDASQTDLYQDGTEDHPYRDINQAIGSIGSNIKFATIHLADGEYNYTASGTGDKQRNRFCNMAIYITGTSEDADSVILNNGIYIHNAKLDIRYVTIKADRHEGILAYDSNITCLYCKFTSDREEAGDFTNGITSHNCRIDLAGCAFDNLNLCVNTHNDYVNCSSTSFSNSTSAVILRNAVFINNNNSFDTSTLTNVITQTVSSYIAGNPRLLYTGQASSGDITLSDNITKYSRLLIVIGSTNSGTITSESWSFASEGFVATEKLKVQGVNGLVSLTGTDNGNKLTVSSESTDNMIRKIYAFKDYRG